MGTFSASLGADYGKCLDCAIVNSGLDPIFRIEMVVGLPVPERHWLKCVARIVLGSDRDRKFRLPAGERERLDRMGSRLYVGNLPFSANEVAVRELFSQDGRTVSEVKLITDRDTGRPRGFGFVEMSNSEEADQAASALNGYSMDGRALTVNEAKERSSSGGGGGGGGGRGGGGGYDRY